MIMTLKFWIAILFCLLVDHGTLLGQKKYSCLPACSLNTSDSILKAKNGSLQNDSVLHLINCVLTSYPKLQCNNIVIKRKNISTMAAARPKSNFLFKKKAQRDYVIILSKNPRTNADSLYYFMPCKAFVGLIAHEIGHLLDYSEKSAIAVLGFGFSYYFKKRKVERHIDELTIKHGYGSDLIIFNQYILSSPFATPEYLKNKRRNYMSVNEIADTLDTL